MDKAKKTVLAIEDNQLNMKLIRALIQLDDIRLREAGDAESGIEILKREKPDLILMDIQLPGMDGYSAIRSIKNDPGLSDIPIVVLTAYAMPEDKRKAIQSGCDDYIAKPIDTHAFLATIRKFLTRGRGEVRKPGEAAANRET